MPDPSPQPPEVPAVARQSRGPWITETEVWKACQRLAAQRIPLTTPRVRKEIGDRGSNTTVRRYIDSWVAAHREQPGEVAVDPATPAPDQLREPMQLVWDRARLEVREEVAAEREALAVKAQELDARHEKDQKEIQDVRNRNDQLQAIVTGFESRIASLESQLKTAAREMREATSAHGGQIAQLGVTLTAAGETQAAALKELTTAAHGLGETVSDGAKASAQAATAVSTHVQEVLASANALSDLAKKSITDSERTIQSLLERAASEGAKAREEERRVFLKQMEDMASAQTSLLAKAGGALSAQIAEHFSLAAQIEARIEAAANRAIKHVGAIESAFQAQAQLRKAEADGTLEELRALLASFNNKGDGD